MINNSTLLELLAWDAMNGLRHPERRSEHSERQAELSKLRISSAAAPQQPAGGMRRGVAFYLVRLGLRLDPAAGGDLGRPLSAHAAHTEAGRCA